MSAVYIVTGAAGHLGSTVIRALLAQGKTVRGLLLPGEHPKVSGPEYIYGNVLEPENIQALFRRDNSGSLTVIHTAGLIDVSGNMYPQLHAVNVTGTKNVIALCQKHRVDKLVYVSSVHAIPETQKLIAQVDPTCFSPERVVGGYAKTKAEATCAVLDSARMGLPAVVVHPSGIIGPFDEGHNHLVQLVRDHMEGHLPACVKGGYDLVDVRDVAEGCLLAAEHGKVGECYILAGSYQEIRDILTAVGALCGRKCPLTVPTFLARMGEPFLRAISSIQGRRPLYTRYSLETVNSPTRFSSVKARKELGYSARDFSITLRDTVNWLLKVRCLTAHQ